MKTNDPQAPSLHLDTLLYRKGMLTIRALNHPLRQQMLKLMHQRGRATVTEIYTKLRLEQPVASQHLGILRNAGYVKTQREGKLIYYAVNYTLLEEANRVIEGLVTLTRSPRNDSTKPS